MERPALCLLNIGGEPARGTRTIQKAFGLIMRSGFNFIGSMEPHELFDGKADAVICDGLVGNIVMKMYEGLCAWMTQEPGAIARRKKGGRCGSWTFRALGRKQRCPACVPDCAQDRGCEKMPDLQAEQTASPVDFRHFSAMVFFENCKNRWSSAPK